MRTRFSWFALPAVLLIPIACSGSNSAPTAPLATPKAMQDTPAASSTSIRIVVPRYGPAVAARKRRPAYVSPSTQSIGVTVSPASAAVQTPAYTNITSTSCTQNTVAITCNVDAPIYATQQGQTVSIGVTTYDAPNGAGNLLSSGTVMTIIQPGVANNISLSLIGKVASLVAFFVEPIDDVPQTLGETLLIVQALDADGNVIVSSTGEPLDRPITISSTDTSGEVGFPSDSSSSSVAPTMTLTNLSGLYQDGIPIEAYVGPISGGPFPGVTGPTTFTVSAPGIASVTASLLLAAPTTPASSAVTANQYAWKVQGGTGFENFAASSNGAIWTIASLTSSDADEFVKVASNGDQQITSVPQNDLVTNSAPGLSGDEWALASTGPIDGANGSPLSATDAGLLHVDTNGNLTTIPIVDPPNAPGSLTPIEFLAEGGLGTNGFSPAALFDVNGIAVAPDGTVWFTDYVNGALWHYNGAAFSIFPIPGPSYGQNGINSMSVVVHPNGKVYFVEQAARAVGVFNPATSSFSQIPLPYYGTSYTNLVVGADGNLWLAQNGPGELYRINLNGSVNAYTIGYDFIGELGVASDGIWMSTADPKLVNTSICAIKSSYGGALSFYEIPNALYVNALTVASDGRVWLDTMTPPGAFAVFTP